MAKTPTKKPAAKRGGKAKSAQVNKKTKAKNRPKTPPAPKRKSTARARNSALPHVDATEPGTSKSFSGAPDADTVRALEAQGYTNWGGEQPVHPTVEEQFRADQAAQAARAAQLEWPERIEEAPRRWTRFLSAITGLFVSLGFAKRHPRTTVGEKVER